MPTIWYSTCQSYFLSKMFITLHQSYQSLLEGYTNVEGEGGKGCNTITVYCYTVCAWTQNCLPVLVYIDWQLGKFHLSEHCKDTKKFSYRKQAHVGMEPNQTGTAPRHTHTIPTSCGILLTEPRVCWYEVHAGFHTTRSGHATPENKAKAVAVNSSRYIVHGYISIDSEVCCGWLQRVWLVY